MAVIQTSIEVSFMKKGTKEKNVIVKSVVVAALVIAVLVCIILLIYKTIYEEKRSNIIKDGKMTAIQSTDKFNEYLDTGINLVKLSSSTINDMLDKNTNDEILDYMVGQTTAITNTIFENTTGLYGYINGEYLDGVLWVPDDDYVPTERPWYKKAVANNGEITMVEPYLDAQTGEMILAICKMLDDGKSVVSMDITIDVIQHITEGAVMTDSSDIEFIVDDQGTVIAHSDTGEVGKNYNEEKNSVGSIAMELINSSNEDYCDFHLGNAHYIAYSSKIPNDWYCVFVKDATSVFAPLNIIFIAAIISILVIIALTSIIMTRYGMRQIMSERLSNQLASTADIYVSMHEIDFATDTFTEVRNSNEEASRIIGEERNNGQEMLRKIMSEFSDETTREGLLDFVDFTKLNERLQDKRTVTCEFLNNEKKWRRARFIVSDRAMDGKVKRAMFLVEDIEVEKRERDKVYNTAQTLANQIRSIANIYTSVHDVDLINDSFAAIEISDNVIENTIGGSVGNCQQVIRNVMSQLTDEISRKEVLEFVDFDNIRKNVGETGLATIEFLNSRGKWCRGRLIASERTEDGRLSHVIWATEDIDEEKRKRDMLTSAAETLTARISSIANIYMTSHEIDIENDSFIEIKSDSKMVNSIVGESRDNAQNVLNMVMNNVVDASCLEDVLKFIDFSTLEKRMRKSDTITMEFLTVEKKWRRGRFIVSKRDENGKLVRVIWLTEDIDDEKRERDELRDASERALAASEAKSSFLSNMSHEIRTPINAVLGMNEMILRECSDNNILAYSENIRTAGSTLLGIVNDILDFSKIEAGKMEIIPVDYDLSSLINDLVNMIHAKADDKGLKLILKIEKEVPKFLHGDEVRIKQVITNILTNAVKYTEEGSVTLIIDYEKVADDADSILLDVCVTDTGIGIKPEDMKKLFSEFDRIEEERNRNVEGTGLGMSITKHLLNMMGSTLEVESVYGLGSKFSFKLAQTVVGWEEIGDYEASYKASLGKHAKYHESFRAPEAEILVVDDNEMNLIVFQNLLKQTDVKIDTAMSGDEGLALSSDKKYDIIFLDHMMPEKDGIETLRELRSRSKDPNLETPAICLTANAISGAKEKYISAGFDDYLTKPIDFDKLEELLRKYLPEEKIGEAEENLSGEDPAADGSEQLPDEYDQRLELLSYVNEIDVDAGLQNNGSQDAYFDLLKIFKDSAPAKIAELEELYASGDIPAYTIKVHALKSSARIIGAADLGEEAQRLEDAGKAEDTEYIKAHHSEFMEEYSRIVDSLKEIFVEEEKTEEPLADQEVMDKAYAEIREAAESMDCGRLEDIFNEMEDYSIPESDVELWQELKEAADILDYDSVIAILERMEA